MPTIITHAFVGAAGSRLLPTPSRSVLALASLCAVLPDADVLAFRFGIAYGDGFGHRGFSHSILFAAITGVLAGWCMWRLTKQREHSWMRWTLFFFLVTLTHPILDACTNGGLGVAFFWPFDSTRYFFPFTPIKVAPIAVSRFFSLSVLPVLISELVWVWLPVVVLIVVGRRALRRSRTVTV